MKTFKSKTYNKGVVFQLEAGKYIGKSEWSGKDYGPVTIDKAIVFYDTYNDVHKILDICRRFQHACMVHVEIETETVKAIKLDTEVKEPIQMTCLTEFQDKNEWI